MSTARPTHAVPDGPPVSAGVNGDTVVIRWEPVSDPPDGFPDRRIDIVAYQIIAGSFQVTLPASSTEVTLPVEFVESLSRGEHGFEVLAIEAGGHQDDNGRLVRDGVGSGRGRRDSRQSG